MKKKNQELEKFKFVLDYKIKELKSQIEPRENEIKEMKLQVSKMDAELGKYHTMNADLHIQMSEKDLRLNASTEAITKEKARNAVLRNTLDRIRADIAKVIENIQTPKALADSVRKLHRAHVVKDTETETTADEDAQKEFNRQREFLERSIASLRKKVRKKLRIFQLRCCAACFFFFCASPLNHFSFRLACESKRNSQSRPSQGDGGEYDAYQRD